MIRLRTCRKMLKILIMMNFFNQAFSNPQFNFGLGIFSTPGPVSVERDFSNFVDLPSQRLQSSRGLPARLTASANHVDPNCALIIPGYEYCITYSVVDSAFYSALEKLRLPLNIDIRDTFDRDEVNNLAEIIQETTRIIAQTYGLSQDVVYDSLSLIDTSRTMISRYCPLSLQPKQCQLSRYREIDGTCNNLENPQWGSAMMAFSRVKLFKSQANISNPVPYFLFLIRRGRPLPSPRLISSLCHTDKSVHEYAISILFVAWGQFIDHDVTLTAETHDVKCCQGPNVTHPSCLPISIPNNDPFYSRYRQGCMNFVRSRAGLRAECKLGPREQFNQISATIDANTVYSNEHKTIRKLRSYVGGKMKTLPVFGNLGLKDLLPLNLEDPDRGCIRPNKDVYCFFTGDPRVSEQTVLSLIHTLFIREHNRLADELAVINPHWSDETIFQEVRHIVAAIVQHITLVEFLPLVLGKQGLHEHGLTPFTHGYYTGYNKEINPSAASGNCLEFLGPKTERWSRSHQFVGTQRLSEMLQQPYDLFKPGWADQYLLGMLNQVAQAMDDSVTEQVTNHLFEEPGKGFGMDLASLNIQRGREHGIPSFNRWREWCGLKPFKTWHDLQGVMFNTSLVWYPRLYESPEDIDLWSGGVSEIPQEGSLLGPTFTCIIGRQFFNLRAGDRFWYENNGWPSSFTLEQLEQIRQSSLARLICDNSDDIESIQLRAMLLPDYKINPRLSCYSSEVPRIDLTPWRDVAYHYNYKK